MQNAREIGARRRFHFSPPCGIIKSANGIGELCNGVRIRCPLLLLDERIDYAVLP